MKYIFKSCDKLRSFCVDKLNLSFTTAFFIESFYLGLVGGGLFWLVINCIFWLSSKIIG